MDNFFEFINQIPRPYPIEYGLKLYNVIKKQKPTVCYEFGSSWGFTTSIIAKALHDIGNKEATQDGIELYSKKLKELLENKTNITQEEFDTCNIINLKAEHYIIIDGNYYIPISEESNYLKWENIGNVLPSSRTLEKIPELELALENKTIFTEEEILKTIRLCDKILKKN